MRNLMRVLVLLSIAQIPFAIAASAQAVTIISRPALAPGVDALPRLKSGALEQEKVDRINRHLDSLDANALKAMQACHATMAQDRGKEAASASWQRKARVTFSSSSLLSILVKTDAFCEGAHPDSDLQAFVFDLDTGAPLNWLKVLPPAAKGILTTSLDGTKDGAVQWDALLALEKKSANQECRDVFNNLEEPPSFVLWLDGSRHTILAQQDDLPFAVQACGQPVVITMQAAAQLGVQQSFLDRMKK